MGEVIISGGVGAIVVDIRKRNPILAPTMNLTFKAAHSHGLRDLQLFRLAFTGTGRST